MISGINFAPNVPPTWHPREWQQFEYVVDQSDHYQIEKGMWMIAEKMTWYERRIAEDSCLNATDLLR